MKILNLQLSVVIMLTLLMSCHQSNQSSLELQKQYDEIIRIHDEVMPRTSELHRLVKQLKEKLDLESNVDIRKKWETAINDLEMADEGMMDWMHKFKKPDHGDIEISRKYYESELEKIQKVKMDMEQSINIAENILAQ